MRILLTGAGGFVGRHLARALAGHDAVRVLRRGDVTRASTHEIVADLSEPYAIRSLPRSDVVMHLGQPRRGEPDRRIST